MKYDPTYQKFYSYYDESLSSNIYESLKDNNNLTEETFIDACKKSFKKHLDNLKKQTKIEFLHLESHHGGFELIAARKETKKEEKERLKEENQLKNAWNKNILNVVKQFDFLDNKTIVALIFELEKKKEELQGTNNVIH